MKNATILSIQTGKVKKEKNFISAFDKNEKKEKVTVTKMGIIEDEIGDTKHHGGVEKAIFANSFHNYKEWAEYLHVKTLNYGALGENLTIDEINETNVCIGDIHKIGTCILQVAQPRKPCWKISRYWKHNDFTHFIYESGKTGWYYRVLKEGEFDINSKLIIEKAKNSVSIEDANAAFREPRKYPQLVELLLSLDTLATSWKNGLIRKEKGEEKLKYMYPPK